MTEPQTQETPGPNPLQQRLEELEAQQKVDRDRVGHLQELIRQAQTEIQTRSGHILARGGRISELKRILDG